jgi:[methyl-Co(III) methanol-specific corrinoid protein]:coenzyme M methyltransferase
MTEMTARDRVMAVMTRNGVNPDRPPCFSVDSTATYDQMKAMDARWPAALTDAALMARLALGAHAILGFDAVRVPFCQTTEAEALGCALKGVTDDNVPSVRPHPAYKLGDPFPVPDDFLSRGRIPATVEAVKILKREVGNRAAVIGGVIGPFSLAASILGTTTALKESWVRPHNLRPMLEASAEAARRLAAEMVAAGADIICVEDMLATTDMISPKTFNSLILSYEKELFGSISVPTVLHICGDVTPIAEDMAATGATALSYEPKSDTATMRQKVGPDVVLVCGADAATTLFNGTPEQVEAVCLASLEAGADVVAAGCAIAPGTPTENLRAMVTAALRYADRAAAS